MLHTIHTQAHHAHHAHHTHHAHTSPIFLHKQIIHQTCRVIKYCTEIHLKRAYKLYIQITVNFEKI